MKKKLAATIVSGILAASMFAGCGGAAGSSAASGASSSAASGSSAAESTSGKPEYNMTLVMAQRDEFLSTLESAAQEFSEANGVTLTSQDAQNDINKQIQFIESARNAGEDAVIVNIATPDAGRECIEAAGDMAVVFVNLPLTDMSILNDYDNAVVVASNEDTAGAFQGEYLANYFKEQGKTEIKYLMLQGILGNVPTIKRSESVLKALEDNGIKAEEAAAPLAAEFDRATALDMISPLLTTTEYDCIIANNDAMALGAIEALEAANLDPTKIPVVGIDCTVDGAQAVEEGKMAMTVYQNPYGQGSGSIQAALNLINGKAPNEGTEYELAEDNEHVIWVPFEPVTKDNVADYK